jgi:glucose-1-phosphate adenylyltransferase
LTYIEVVQPARIVDHGNVSESIIANGVIIEGSNVDKSVLSYDIRIQKGSSVKESILLGENIIGKNVKINRAIIEKKINIPDNETVGIDRKKDEARGFTVTNSGITIIPKGYKFE